MGNKVIFATDLHASSRTPASRVDDYPKAVLGKFEYVLQKCREYDAPLLLGGDTFDTPNQIDWLKNQIRSLIRKSGVTVYTEIGNHDVLYYDLSTVDKTSFGIMTDSMIWLAELKNSTAKFKDDWKFVGHEFGDKTLPEVDEKSVIVSHMAIESKYEKDRLYLNPEEIRKSKARFICLGHDHNQYKIKELGGTLVVRPGALSRGSSNTENRVRDISYAVLDLDEGTAWYETVLSASKFEDVFKENYDVKREKTVVSFDEIQKFIDEFKTAKADADPYDILSAMGVSDEIFDSCSYYLREVGLLKQS